MPSLARWIAPSGRGDVPQRVEEDEIVNRAVEADSIHFDPGLL